MEDFLDPYVLGQLPDVTHEREDQHLPQAACQPTLSKSVALTGKTAISCQCDAYVVLALNWKH